jgi:hypothetical protein
MVVRSPNDQLRRKPEDWYIPAVVVKAARVWVEIAQAGKEDLPKWVIYRWRMRRDTQDEGTQYSGSDARFLTMEQYAWEETRRWALGVLTENGIDLQHGSVWVGREAELADLLVTRAAKEGEEK